MMASHFVTFVLCFVTFVVVGARPALADDRLGRIAFPTSGSAAAQPHFIRGVLLMHSFEFDDAADAFRQARTIDPGFAMAYWGEALTYNHPLWRYQDRDAALKVLTALGPTPEARRARAATPREQGYLATLDALYGEGPKADRDRAYAAALEALSRKYPDDDEARTLHALAILGTNVERRDFAVDMRAAALVEDVFMRNQEHPGALHYMIHAYDNPMHAPLGLRAASRYGRIAQQAAHALHMTSHIFFALGQWDDSIAANEASWAASRARVEKKGLGPAEHGYHAYLWLSYAYLQKGRIDDARRIVDEMGQLLARAPVRVVAYHYGAARAAWIVDSERWSDLPPVLDVNGPAPPSAKAASLFADGLAAARLGNLAGVEKARTAVEALKQAGASGESHHGMSTLSPADREGVNVTALQLAGLAMLTGGEKVRGIELLKQAVQAEAAMPYDYGPPFPAKPANELLGEALLAEGRRDEAAEAFKAALKRAPGRRLSIAGLAKAEVTERSPATATR
jgi:tetratricopeptide (TPR) repeat protein